MSSYHYTALNTNQSEHVIPAGPEWTKADMQKREAQMEEHMAFRKRMAKIAKVPT